LKKKKFLTGTMVAALTSAGTLFVVMMYVGGEAFRADYLHEHSLYEALMPWTPQQMMFFGFDQSCPIILAAFVALAAYLLFLCGIFAIIDHWSRRKAAEKSETVNDVSLPRESREQRSFPLVDFLGVVGAAVSFLTILGAFVLYEGSQGRHLAHSQRMAVEKVKCIEQIKPQMEYARIVRGVGSGAPQTTEGYVVTCDPHACALYPAAPATKKVVVVPLDNVMSFETWYPSDKCDVPQSSAN
jgi:hypothetical protein